MERRRALAEKRVKEVKETGVDQRAYPQVIQVVPVNSRTSHRIQTLTSAHHLNQAAELLADADRDDELLRNFLHDTDEVRHKFIHNYVHAYLRATACFNLVLGYFDANEDQPRSVMACVPVLSPSQEEIDVCTSYEALLEYGFCPSEFPFQNLLDDEVMELFGMKRKRAHGLTKRPHLYIAFFDTDYLYIGHGCARSLLQIVIELSESKKLPLVLESTDQFLTSQYERYGFMVVDSVEERSGWVLMVREVTGMGAIKVDAFDTKDEWSTQANLYMAELKLKGTPEPVHLLEFNRHPGCLDRVLLDSVDLQECNHHSATNKATTGAEHCEPRDVRVLSSKAKVFVPLALYGPVVRALQAEEYSQLTARHVVVAERFIDVVLDLVRSLPGFANVHEKRSKRRDVPVHGTSGGPNSAMDSILVSESDGEMIVKHTFIHVPTNDQLGLDSSRPVTC